jgi:hypothetical protein
VSSQTTAAAAGGGGSRVEQDWDAGAPWYRWGHQRDPIGAIELDLVWEWRQVVPPGADTAQGPAAATYSSSTSSGRPGLAGGSSSHPPRPTAAGAAAPVTAEEAAALLSSNCAGTADLVLLHVLERGYRAVPRREGALGMSAPERYRRYVTLQRAGEALTTAAWLTLCQACTAGLSCCLTARNWYNARYAMQGNGTLCVYMLMQVQTRCGRRTWRHVQPLQEPCLVCTPAHLATAPAGQPPGQQLRPQGS